jgi:hypothetical protein
MSHSTYNSDAFPELFESTDDKSLIIDYPLSTKVIAKHQKKTQTWRDTSNFTKQVDGHNVIILNNKIYIPITLRKEI